MRARPGRSVLFAIAAGLVLALTPALATAQDDEGGGTEPADDGDRQAPPPRSGSLFGNRPPQRSAGGGELTSGQVDREEEAAADDSRTELLVFDLIYDDGATFQNSYLERFEATFWEAVEASGSYRAISPAERQRRLARAAALATGELHDDDAERMAEAIGVSHYLIPRVEVANSRTYRIHLTFGTVGEGEAGRQDFTQESNRTIDNVDDAIESMAAQAVETSP